MKPFTLLILLACAHTFADDALTHAAAHIGTSFAINQIAYGFNTKILKLNQPKSLVLAAIAALAVGFTFKAVEGIGQGGLPPSTGRAMIENAAGVGAAIGTNLVFKF
jgi:hypothetical protein